MWIIVSKVKGSLRSGMVSKCQPHPECKLGELHDWWSKDGATQNEEHGEKIKKIGENLTSQSRREGPTRTRYLFLI